MALSARHRTLYLLGSVGRAYRPVSLAELSAGLNWPKATVLRCASALVVEGLLVRDSSGHYSLGPASWAIQHMGNYRAFVTAACRPELERIGSETGETALLVRYEGRWVRLLASVPGSNASHADPPGSLVPLQNTALGWVYLAWTPPSQRHWGLARHREPLAAMSVMGQHLEHELHRVTTQGFAADWGGIDGRLATVAAPIFSYAQVALGIGIVTHRRSLSRSRAEQLGHLLHAAGIRATAALDVPATTRPYESPWSLTDPAERP